MEIIERIGMPMLLHATPHTWTREEYLRMVEVGLLSEQDRVELVEGHILALSSSDPKHDDGIANTNTLLVPAFAATHLVRVQLTYDVGAISMPQPDFLFIKRVDAVRGQYATRADLIIEVANTSLAYDREVKGSLYAREKVPEYWILDVAHQRLLRHRDPGKQKGTFVGHAYHAVVELSETNTVSALALPGVEFPVAQML